MEPERSITNDKFNGKRSVSFGLSSTSEEILRRTSNVFS